MSGPATKSQAYAIHPPALEAQLNEWRSLQDRLVANLDLAQRDYAGSTTYWTGNAGERAREATSTTITEGRKIITALNDAIAAGTSGQLNITTSKNTATAAIDLAVRDKFTVAEDGTVTAPDARLSLPDAKTEDLTAAQAALDATAKNIYQPPIKAALLGLGQAIETTTVAIEKAFDNVGAIKPIAQAIQVRLGERTQQVQDILDGTAQLPATTRDFHEFWTTLSDEDKDALWNEDPYIGNRDGMPATDRDHYNRLTLDEQLTAAQNARSEADRLAAAHPEWSIDAAPTGMGDAQTLPAGSAEAYQLWQEKMDESRHLEDLMGTSKALEPPTDPTTGEVGEPRMLLGMDDKSGERVHAIVADGNPDTASHVTTYVPGTSSQPAKLEGDMVRVDRMTEQAENSGAPNPVTVAWMGYDAPPTVLSDATQRDYAQAGAPALNSFQDGLRASHEGEPSRNTVLGHSYGTTVVGLSAGEGRTLDADAVVMVASPGAGVETARDLSLAGVPDGQQYQHVYSTQSFNDPTPLYENIPDVIPGVDRHGGDPTELEFGGQVFASDSGSVWPFGAAHSEYWEPGSTSLVNMGHIIAGQLGRVTYA